MLTARLPVAPGRVETYQLGEPLLHGDHGRPSRSRVVFAAAHVVADPFFSCADSPGALDWEATLAFRHHLWDLGLGVAEAMDTAQRGMGLSWPQARELIERSAREAVSRRAQLCAGAQTDHLAPGQAHSLADVKNAYLSQCEVVESAGATVVLMASRELCRVARGPDDYAEVYGAVLQALDRPAILHWLGEAFDPQLAGYWGAKSYQGASRSCLDIITANRAKVDGVKLSLLDARKEVDLRRRLPSGVRMYTGDDFNFPELIAGDGHRHSDALLGAFDFAATAASWSLEALDGGRDDEFCQRLAPAVALSRWVFAAPTQFYKTGTVFLAYLNGHQQHFKMVGGLESGRSLVHLAQCFRLADQAGLLCRPELAVERMGRLLAVAGLS